MIRYFIVTGTKYTSGHVTGIIKTNGHFPKKDECLKGLNDIYGMSISEFISITEISEVDYYEMGEQF